MRNEMLQARIAEFSAATSEAFAFLGSDYGFQQNALEQHDQENILDSRVSVPFISRQVGLEVVMGLGDDSISIVFYELDHGRRPKKISFYSGRETCKAARLETVLRVKTQKDPALPLPEIIPGLSVAEMARRGESRSRKLRENLRKIMFEYADLVRHYARDILQGDTSRFDEYCQYHSKFWRW